jgi:uncharacterized membrane protein
MRYKRCGLIMVFIWFSAGGIAHFLIPEFFLKTVPSLLPLRMEAVYISGFFELLGALLLLWRRWAGIGLMTLTLAATPANIYIRTHSHLFPQVPEILLVLRLVLRLMLIATIWWVIQPVAETR